MSLDIAGALTELIGPLVADLPRDQQPAVIALAERVAASRYRAWAEQAGEDEAATILRACAEREEEIATRVETITPEAAKVQADVRASHPDLPERYAALFAGEPLAGQLALQAQAERTGAGVWRSLAATSEEPTRGVYNTCADLEEASAEAVEKLIAGGLASPSS